MHGERKIFLNLKPKNVFSRFSCILSIQTCSKIYAKLYLSRFITDYHYLVLDKRNNLSRFC